MGYLSDAGRHEQKIGGEYVHVFCRAHSAGFKRATLGRPHSGAGRRAGVGRVVEFPPASAKLEAARIVHVAWLTVLPPIIEKILQFLHFIEQRHAASNTKLIVLDDELDHLGMYLTKNCYAQFADEFVAANALTPDLLVWSGFTKEIDKYYAYLLMGEPIDLPKQDIPSTILEILSILTKEDKLGRAWVASKLLDMSGETRQNFESNVRRSTRLTRERMRPQPVSLFGEVQITVYCNPSDRSFRGRSKTTLVQYAKYFYFVALIYMVGFYRD